MSERFKEYSNAPHLLLLLLLRCLGQELILWYRHLYKSIPLWLLLGQSLHLHGHVGVLLWRSLAGGEVHRWGGSAAGG